MADTNNSPWNKENPGAGGPEQPYDFREQARLGKNDWWRYVLTLLILGAVIAVGVGTVLGGLLYPGFSPDPEAAARAGVPDVAYFAFSLSGPVVILTVVLLAVRFIHGRPIKSLITAYRRIRWGRILLALGLWATLMAASFVVSYALDPSSLQFALEPERFLLFLPFVLLLVPIQTTSEEVFDRGYLLQLLGLWVKSTTVLVLIGGLWFGVGHLGNLAFFAQTAGVGPGLFLLFLYYFVVGAFYVWMTLRDNGLELALGHHAAHNLFLTLIVSNPEDVSSGTPALFTSSDTGDPFALSTLLTDNIIQIVMFALFAFVVFRFFSGRKRRATEVK